MAHTTNPKTTVAFSGYRLQKLFPQGNYNLSREQLIRRKLADVIQALYQSGFRTFISGMATGFDLWAAYTVITLRDVGTCPDMQLIAAVPCPGQVDGFDAESRTMYTDLLYRADHMVVISPDKSRACFLKRNDWMLEHASVLVCYYDGRPGGTHYTFQKAHARNMRIINIYTELPP